MHAEEELELRALMDEAELELASGDFTAALRIAEDVLARPSELVDAGLERAALTVRAGALEASGDLESAIETLTDLVADSCFDRTWVQSQISLIRCLREQGAIARAISVGEDAVARFRSAGSAQTTESIQLIVTLASAYLFAGDSGQASRLCKRAIAAADQVGSSLARASAYWNTSVIEADNGEYERALSLAEIVVAEFEGADDGRNLGRIRSLVADLQMCIDPPDPYAALATLDQADRELEWSSAGAVDLARLHRYRGEAYFLIGDHVQAREHLRRCEEMVPSGLSTLAASVPVILGRIAFDTGDLAEARYEYQRAIMILSSIGADRDAARLWLELGDLLRQLGDREGAHDAFHRAASSTGLQPRRLRPL